jgi:hypothetical protein
MIGNQVALKKDQQKAYGIATSVIIFAGTGASRYIMSEEEQEYGWGLTMKEVQFAIVLLAWFGLHGVWLCLSGAVFQEAGAWMDQSSLDGSILLDDWVPMAFGFAWAARSLRRKKKHRWCVDGMGLVSTGFALA